MIDATKYLRDKGLLKDGFSKFIITHPELGEIDLAEFLDEFGEMVRDDIDFYRIPGE